MGTVRRGVAKLGRGTNGKEPNEEDSVKGNVS